MHVRELILIGLFVLAAPAVQAQNLVTNPGFETGDFTGWTLTGDGDSIVDIGVGHTGMYAASLGAIPPDQNDLTQPLTTKVGQSYVLSFFAQTPEFNNPPGFPNSLAVYFGDTLVAGPFQVPDDPNYQAYSYLVTATAPTTLLHFVVTNEPDYTQLDDISVVAVPEPGTLALLLGGGCGAGIWRRRSRRR
ncbi:MAG TPA: PEP-CTERM sorting domain-containing protein [Chthonomonadaceae bacterium]|nr:PEP-CTERM sorting domain-containing protein [Chthonomonadaceae bacterium]